MPRSFLVKKAKCDDDRPPHHHSYRVRDEYDDTAESVKAITPYTPATPQQVAVTVSNGKCIHLVDKTFNLNEPVVSMLLHHIRF